MLHCKFEQFCYHGFLSTHCTMNDERSLYLTLVHSILFHLFGPTISFHQIFFSVMNGGEPHIFSQYLVWVHLHLYIRNYDRFYGGGYYFRISSTPPEGWHLFNIYSYLLICGHISYTCEVNMLTDFQTSTMKFRRIIARIDHFISVTSNFLKGYVTFCRN